MFTDWIYREMANRGWTQAQLARRAVLSQPTISMVLNRQKEPGQKFCRGIARAFKLPPEEVFRKAGILPAVPEKTDSAAELVYKFTRLSDDGQELALEFIATLLEREERRRGVTTPQTAPASANA